MLVYDDLPEYDVSLTDAAYETWSVQVADDAEIADRMIAYGYLAEALAVGSRLLDLTVSHTVRNVITGLLAVGGVALIVLGHSEKSRIAEEQSRTYSASEWQSRNTL